MAGRPQKPEREGGPLPRAWPAASVPDAGGLAQWEDGGLPSAPPSSPDVVAHPKAAPPSQLVHLSSQAPLGAQPSSSSLGRGLREAVNKRLASPPSWLLHSLLLPSPRPPGLFLLCEHQL